MFAFGSLVCPHFEFGSFSTRYRIKNFTLSCEVGNPKAKVFEKEQSGKYKDGHVEPGKRFQMLIQLQKSALTQTKTSLGKIINI